MIMQWKLSGILSFLLACQVVLQAEGYRPVILMHGMISNPSSMDTLVQRIEGVHPGTPIYNIDAYNNLDSFTPMWEQVHGVHKIIAPILETLPQGAILIGYSQGGVLLRGLVELYPTHNITFISLGTPIGGQYGDAEISTIFPFLDKENIYKYCYTIAGQNSMSICNWWRDPLQMELYKQTNNYLYPLNSYNRAFKRNFERLARLVLIGGPDDGIVEPWQSSHFGYYDENFNIVDFQNQEYYINDNFGLRTLHESGRVHFHTVPGVHHFELPNDQSVFDCCIEPWLD